MLPNVFRCVFKAGLNLYIKTEPRDQSSIDVCREAFDFLSSCLPKNLSCKPFMWVAKSFITQLSIQVQLYANSHLKINIESRNKHGNTFFLSRNYYANY